MQTTKVKMIDIENIFNNEDRSNWLNKLFEYDYTIENNEIVINNSFSIKLTPEDINIYEFPFEIGDIVSNKIFGGIFIIYDYPLLDHRRDINYYINNKCLGSYLMADPQYYSVIGYLNDQNISGTQLDSFKGINTIPLTTDDCYWKNWYKINVSEEIYNSLKELLYNERPDLKEGINNNVRYK